jgi:hypothetical protein
MSLTCADVLAGFRARWLATTAITTAITGGLHEGAAPEAAVASGDPYASVACAFKERTQYSGAAIEVFTVTVQVFVAKSAADAGGKLAPVLAAFDLAAGTLAFTPATGTARHMVSVPAQQSLAKDPARVDGEKVLVAQRAWDVWIEVR